MVQNIKHKYGNLNQTAQSFLLIEAELILLYINLFKHISSV